jgi:hypothetical protein
MKDIKHIMFIPPKTSNTYPFMEVQGVEKETDKAIAYNVGGGLFWIPKSLVERFTESNYLSIPQWFKMNEYQHKVFEKCVRTIHFSELGEIV